MSLALATLIYEWRRYLAAVIALAFSGLLILAQVGMFTGMIQAATATINRSRADLMIMPAKSESLINSGPSSLPRRISVGAVATRFLVSARVGRRPRPQARARASTTPPVRAASGACGRHVSVPSKRSQK